MTRSTRSQFKDQVDDIIDQPEVFGSQSSQAWTSQAAFEPTSSIPTQAQAQAQAPPAFSSPANPGADTSMNESAPRRKSTGGGGGNRRGNAPAKRAAHNAIERARRETLNGRFSQLASILPATSDVKRPSKSLIVNKSLAFVEDALARETTYRSQILDLGSRNDSLLEQLNKLRRDQGLKPIEARQPIDLPEPLSDVDAARARVPIGSSDLAGEMDEGDDISGDGGSSYSPHQGQSQALPPTGHYPGYGFAPAPVAPRYYEQINPHQAAYYHQPHPHSPGGLPVAAPQYPQSYEHRSQSSGEHQSNQIPNYQSQHFDSAMDVNGKSSMASASNSMPPHMFQDNSNFSYNGNNFSSNFNNEFTSFGAINFVGFGNNVMLEA